MVGSGFTILVLSLFLAPAIKSANNLQHTFLVTSVAFFVVGSIFFAITFFTSKEVVYREVEKVSLRDTIETVKNNGPLVRLCGSSLFYLTGQNVVSAMGAYLGIDMLGRLSDGNWLTSAIMVITTGAVLYTGPFGPMVTRHLGKRNGFAVASAVAAAGLLIFWIGNSLLANLWVGLLGLFITGASMAVLNTMTWALEADTAEYGELKTGIRTEGATYAVSLSPARLARVWAWLSLRGPWLLPATTRRPATLGSPVTPSIRWGFGLPSSLGRASWVPASSCSPTR